MAKTLIDFLPSQIPGEVMWKQQEKLQLERKDAESSTDIHNRKTKHCI